MVRSLSLLSLGLVALALVALAGCDRGQEKPPQPAAPERQAQAQAPGSPRDGEHAHKPGGHGGNVVEIGRDNYHAEAVFEKGGAVRLYLLGKDEAKVHEAESQTLTAYARAEGATEAVPVTFRPAPQPGDGEGKTSLFLGKLPADLVGRQVEVTVPSIRINGERFRFAFASAAAAHDEGMPERLADAEERQLYLTPGGKYTEADIRANGGMTAAQKFQGQTASHDLKPRPGDKVCPVTLTKANPKFSWVVGGKTYQFCCPPCVDEFVKAAKEQPDQVKGPGEYVKK
jgi:YHS domain-containing protein